MMRDYEKEFQTLRRNAQDIVKTADDPLNHILYLSFNKYGKAVMERENKKFLEDADLDYKIGILTDEEYEKIKLAYSIIEKSIFLGEVY